MNPIKYCEFNGCTNKIAKGAYCEDHKRKKKARKSKEKKSIYHHENKPFYRTQSWQDMRSYIYERERGCCQVCGKFVFGKRAQVHHIIPIKDNKLLSLEENNLMLLCPQCHVIEENKEKKKVFPSYFNTEPKP